MFYIQLKIAIHHPDEYDFSFTQTSVSEASFLAEDYFKKGTNAFKEKEDVVLLGSGHLKGSALDWKDSEVFYWDFLSEKHQKFYRVYTFVLPHEVKEGRTIFEFEFMNNVPYSQMRMFNIQEPPEEFFSEVEQSFFDDSRFLEKRTQMLEYTENSTDGNNAECAMYTQYKLKHHPETIRNYKFLLEQ